MLMFLYHFSFLDEDLNESFLTDPKLPSLLKMLTWAQNQLDEKAAYPRINELSTAVLEDPAV
uniref:Glucose-induced degradation protein 8 homolog isoform X2 n=1 Tax=Rhizophora mucronata TaxID=61149 RepID=A0A2P2LFS9_RHIMU